MPRTFEAGRSRPRILFVLIIASITLLTLDFRDVGPFGSLQTSARNALEPVRSGAEQALDPVTDLWDDVFTTEGASDELDELRAENAKLKGEIITQDNAEDLLASVLLQLDIPYVGNIDRVVTQVVAGSIGNFDDFHIEIDKGTVDGIKVNMPVISEGGLVGRVVEANRSRSRVLLIVDPGFNVGIRVVGSDEELAVAHGGGWGEPLQVTEDINPRAEIEVGTPVLTSGLDNSLYPANIPLGFITDVRLDEGALTQILEIEPAGELESLRFVTVLLFDPDGSDDSS
ncbi:MAG: rod shape-determining protein MreC [Acidimicrobiia bacterium]|nr:rod shape-determining protein MreC [Acidimicrobiia bacterium]